MPTGRTASVIAAGAALALAACGQSGGRDPGAAPTAPAPVATTTAAPVTATPATRPARRQVHRAAPTTAPTTAAPVATTAHRHRHTLLVQRLVGVGNARQVLAVTASGYGTSYATLTGYRKTASGWRQVFGPWAARIGRNGFAPPGDKREGDGRTPTGSFGFQFMFGVDPDPGVHYRYRRALTTSYWDDDPSSARYNEWVDSRYADPGRAPESMYQTPAYDYAAVIAYNTARTPGLGSAIFLHVSHVGATAGCVSIAQSRLLEVLRWLDPSAGPRIVMGPMSAVTR